MGFGGQQGESKGMTRRRILLSPSSTPENMPDNTRYHLENNTAELHTHDVQGAYSTNKMCGLPCERHS